MPIIRVLNTGSGSSYVNISGNTFLPLGSNKNVTFIDFLNSGSIGTLNLAGWTINGNLFEGHEAGNATGTIAIQFAPTMVTTTGGSGFIIAANNFSGLPAPATLGNLVGFKGADATLALTHGHPAAGTGNGISGTGASNFAVTGVNVVGTVANMQETMMGTGTVWKATCTCNAQPGSGNARIITLLKNGSPTAFTCTITHPAQQCDMNTLAPIDFALGDELNWQQSGTGSAGSCVTISCLSYVSHETAL